MVKFRIRNFILTCSFLLLIIAAGAGNSIIAAGAGWIIAPGSGGTRTIIQPALRNEFLSEAVQYSQIGRAG